MKNFVKKVLIALTIVGLAGNGPALAGPEPLVVYASNYPLQFFAQEIAGDALDVRLPDIDGDPAYWVPDGAQAAALQAADLVILNGAGYEGWLNFVTLRPERLLDTTAGLHDRLLPLEEATVHQHGPEGEHSHAGTAFTTWLDPALAIGQARAIAAALTRMAPENAAGFETRLAALEERLKQLDGDLESAFEQLGDTPVWFSHPVYQYLQHRYGINGRSVHWEPEQDPGTRGWIDFQNRQRAHGGTLILWEGEPLADTAKRLSGMGIESRVFELAGNRPGSGDYFEVMYANRQRLLDLGEQP